MIDGIPVIDAVIHAYDWRESNWAGPIGDWIVHAAYGGAAASNTPEVEGRFPTFEQYASQWTIEDTANQVFVEADTDLAVHHALPLYYAFHDGGASIAKTIEAIKRWPARFIPYAGVDALAGDAALEMLEQQAAELDPVGLKLYPDGLLGSEMGQWKMDNPEVAYPIFQRAQDLGIKVVAIHKAIPLGPVPLEGYRVDDIDRAARDFPGLSFEVVHGGMAFLEETAFQLARFPNVYVNLELTTALLGRRPRAFANALATMVHLGGPFAYERILWGTGAMGVHPQQYIELFLREFEYPQDILELTGIPQITLETKRQILGENYARMVGIDLDARLREIEDDEFSRRKKENGGPLPAYSTAAYAAVA